MSDFENNLDLDKEELEEEATLEEVTTDEAHTVSSGSGIAYDENQGYVNNSDSPAKWYVVHTYSGHENKVKVNIEKIVENRGMQDLILDIVVPTEDSVEVKNGQRKVKTRKIFPGYVLVKMIVTNESWYLVRNTQGVTGFVGHGTEPIPLTNEEVRRMGIEKVHIEIDVEVGDNVKVINGPFESFMGVVEEVNMEKETLKVKISMFGRDTPVELEFGQVDKI
jgi:transcriptional antiterminator NusG